MGSGDGFGGPLASTGPPLLGGQGPLASGEALSALGQVAGIFDQDTVAGGHQAAYPPVNADLAPGGGQGPGRHAGTEDRHPPFAALPAHGGRLGRAPQTAVETDLELSDALDIQPLGPLVQLPAGAVGPAHRVPAALGLEA